MNPLTIALLGIAALTSLAYTLGRRDNLVLQKHIADGLQTALKAKSAEFTSIGGVVGFHFHVVRPDSPHSVDGTLTLFPRQALLYYPIARLMRREDELSLLAPLSPLGLGEGHLLERRYWDSGRVDITDSDSMMREDVEIDGMRAVTLAYNPAIREHLVEFARSCPDALSLRHVAYTTVNRSAYILLHPDPETYRDMLGSWMAFLGSLEETGRRL